VDRTEGTIEERTLSQTVAELMRANLHDVFGERDDERRQAAIAQTYTDDVVFSDPDGSVSGHAALDQKARSLLASSPGFVFAEDSPVYSGGASGCLAWQFGPEGQPSVVRGVDFATIRDGRISAVQTLIAG
jgi:SnoaL-like domain